MKFRDEMIKSMTLTVLFVLRCPKSKTLRVYRSFAFGSLTRLPRMASLWFRMWCARSKLCLSGLLKFFSFSGDVAPLPVNLWCRCRRYVVIGRLFSETTRSSWCFEGSYRLPSKGSEIWKDDESIAKATDWQGNVNATCWKPCHTACALGCSLSAKCAYIEVYFEAWTGIKCAICPAGVHCKWNGSRTHT